MQYIRTMLKITRRDGPGDEEVILEIEGTLAGSWVGEVRTACETAVRERRPILLDLRAVTYVDLAGTALLRSLRDDRRVVIGKASALVAELLKGGAA